LFGLVSLRTVSEDVTRGIKAGGAVAPTFVAIFIGVGIAAEVADLPPLATLLSSATVFAAPAQFAMFDMAMQDHALLQIISVGVLVNLRFFVMSLTLTNFFDTVPRRRLVYWAQFVSASSYLVTFFQSRRDEPVDLFDFYRGVVFMTFTAAIVGTAIGVVIGAGLPALLAFGATLFLPIYFSLMLVGETKGRYEVAAVMIGLLFTPPLELLLPGWGLFVAAIGAGAIVTAAKR
jgi:predicted branched-subunit amino acid permease